MNAPVSFELDQMAEHVRLYYQITTQGVLLQWTPTGWKAIAQGTVYDMRSRARLLNRPLDNIWYEAIPEDEFMGYYVENSEWWQHLNENKAAATLRKTEGIELAYRRFQKAA